MPILLLWSKDNAAIYFRKIMFTISKKTYLCFEKLVVHINIGPFPKQFMGDLHANYWFFIGSSLQGLAPSSCSCRIGSKTGGAASPTRRRFGKFVDFLDEKWWSAVGVGAFLISVLVSFCAFYIMIDFREIISIESTTVGYGRMLRKELYFREYPWMFFIMGFHIKGCSG